ncbi:MAG: nitrogenase component 1 [Thermodesulfobacteriota bacterium]
MATMAVKTGAAVSTTNACKLCAPLGAALAFRGIEATVPFLHGSQGCATYMRRYIISHFNEPIDIASSALGEKQAVFGGGPNLMQGLANVIRKYRPRLIGVATTCLTETIGDDVPRLLKDFAREQGDDSELPLLVPVSTPSYVGTHMEGFHAATRAVVAALAEPGPRHGGVNLLPGLVSPADLRHLTEIFREMETKVTILPDFAATLDGPALAHYPLIPAGGTPLAAIRRSGSAAASLELGRTLAGKDTAGGLLQQACGIPCLRLGLPIGIHETDRFLAELTRISGRPVPARIKEERGRLVDAYVDGHKYVFGKRAVVYGEEDLVVGLAAFLAEIGVQPVLCASGGTSGQLAQAVAAATADLTREAPVVREGVDFFEIEELAAALEPDLLVGHSKGYSLARRRRIPLIRVGFPIHDRLGGQRILHLGYRGAQALFDTVANALIAAKQDGSPVGYSYM